MHLRPSHTLGGLGNRTTPAAVLPQKLRAVFGSLQSRVEAYGEAESFDRSRVFFCASASMLNDKVAESDPLLSPRDKGKTADAHYWKKLSYAALCRTRQEILHTTTADVAGYADRMQQAAACSAVCVLGPRRQLEACGDALDTILSI